MAWSLLLEAQMPGAHWTAGWWFGVTDLSQLGSRFRPPAGRAIHKAHCVERLGAKSMNKRDGSSPFTVRST